MGTANIGMMDSAYFVGRNEILSWINSTLQLSLAKVEEAASGAVQCQMMDMIHPGVVPMHKVNFEAKTEYDMIQNYKLLQEVFSKLKIEKHLEVNKLVKGRPLDNLELLQWLKRYCDVMTGGMVVSDYNPIERRSKGVKEGHRKSTASMQSLSHNRASVKSGSKYGRGISAPHGYVSIEQVQGLNDQISQLKLSVTNLEKDRDFYFSKLRDIEILLQNDELDQLPVVMAIQKILYAVDDQESAIADAQALLNKSPPSENESMVFPAEASDDERRESDDNKETSASEVDNTEQIQPSDQPTQQESNFFACGDSNGDCMQQVSSVTVQ